MATDMKGRTKRCGPISDKMREFVGHYLTNGRNGTQAALSAGYAKSRAHVQASELLQTPSVQNEILRYEKELQEKFGHRLQEVVEHLFYCLTRDPADFFNEDGTLKDISEIPYAARMAIDGIEINEHYDEEGNLERITKKLKCVGKASVMDMILKHKGLYAAKQLDIRQQIMDFSHLYGGPPAGARDPDVIEEPEVKVIDVKAKHTEEEE